MLKLWRTRPVLTSAFVLACVLTLFFALRVVYGAVYWANHKNVDVRGWMTVGYIAKSWDLKGPDLDALARLPTPKVKGHPQPLAEIAKDRGVPVADVIAEVEAAIATLTKAKPKP
jgi:hypothetical protein